MDNLDVECGFVFSRFNWETIEEYGGIVVKCIGNNVYSLSRYFRCEPFLVGRCLSDVYVFRWGGYKNLCC